MNVTCDTKDDALKLMTAVRNWAQRWPNGNAEIVRARAAELFALILGHDECEGYNCQNCR